MKKNFKINYEPFAKCLRNFIAVTNRLQMLSCLCCNFSCASEGSIGVLAVGQTKKLKHH